LAFTYVFCQGLIFAGNFCPLVRRLSKYSRLLSHRGRISARPENSLCAPARTVCVWVVPLCGESFIAIFPLPEENETPNPMEQSPFWEANSFSAGQGIPLVLWNLKCHHCVHKSPSLAPILSRMHSGHASLSCLRTGLILSSSYT